MHLEAVPHKVLGGRYNNRYVSGQLERSSSSLAVHDLASRTSAQHLTRLL